MTSWSFDLKHPIDYLLLETADFLLLENGDQIVLEQTGQTNSLWSFPTKN